MGILFPLVLSGQTDPAVLLRQARTKILENIGKLPNYTCVQTVRRSQFEVFYGSGGCSYVDETGGAKGRFQPMLAWTDRFKLDVTISSEGEIFSWAGARIFESTDAQEIVGGGLTGTGDFGGFLKSIFSGDTSAYQYLGPERIEGRDLAAYRYQMPLSGSHYQIKAGPRPEDLATLAYEGKFWIDPANAELARMTVIVPRLPMKTETCRIETTIDYQPRLPLPRLTLLKLWDADGARYENRTEYASCRAFQSESVFRPDLESSIGDSAPVAKTPVSIPRGKALRIVLRSKIDLENAFAGDPVEGQLLQPIRGHGGSVLAPRGATVHGRIVRFEQHYLPSRYFVLGLKYYSLVANGVEIPLALAFTARSRAERDLMGSLEKREGIGMFVFQGEPLALDGAFVSEWKTTAR